MSNPYGLRVDIWNYDYTGKFFFVDAVNSAATATTVFNDKGRTLIKLILRHSTKQSFLKLLETGTTVPKSRFAEVPADARYTLHLDTYYSRGRFSGDGFEVRFGHQSGEFDLDAVADNLPDRDRRSTFKTQKPPETQEKLTSFLD